MSIIKDITDLGLVWDNEGELYAYMAPNWTCLWVKFNDDHVEFGFMEGLSTETSKVFNNDEIRDETVLGLVNYYLNEINTNDVVTHVNRGVEAKQLIDRANDVAGGNRFKFQ